jgi:hypothetical protein
VIHPLAGLETIVAEFFPEVAALEFATAPRSRRPAEFYL